MSAGHSDLISLLSTSTPLGANETVTTAAYIPGQYSSLSIICYPATTTEVEVQFSGDGVNWDVIEFKSFTGGTGGVEAVVVLSKWVRLRIINTAGAQDFLRVSTYGTIRNSVVQAVIDTSAGGPLPEVNINNLPGNSSAARSESARILFSFTGLTVQPCLHSLTINQNGGGNKSFSIDGDLYQIGYTNPSPTVAGRADIQGQDQNGRHSFVVLSGDKLGVTSPVGETKAYLSPRYTSGTTTGDIVYTFCTDFSGKLSSLFEQGNFFTSAPPIGPVRNQVLVGLTEGLDNGKLIDEDFICFGAFDENYTVSHTEMNCVWGSLSVINPVVIPQSLFNIDRCDGTRNLPAFDLYNYPPGTNYISGRIVVNFSQQSYIRWELQHPLTGVYYPVHQITQANFEKRAFCALIHKHEVKQGQGPIALSMTHNYQSLVEQVSGTGAMNIRSLYKGTSGTLTSTGDFQDVIFVRKRSRDFQGGQVTHNILGTTFQRHLGEVGYIGKVILKAYDQDPSGGPSGPNPFIRVRIQKLHQYQLSNNLWAPIDPQGNVTGVEISFDEDVTVFNGDNFPLELVNVPIGDYRRTTNDTVVIDNELGGIGGKYQALDWCLYPGAAYVVSVKGPVGRTINYEADILLYSKI